MQKYVGVMAQDLVGTRPDVLTHDEQGYYRVNYTQLGLKMVSLKEWNEQGADSILDLN